MHDQAEEPESERDGFEPLIWPDIPRLAFGALGDRLDADVGWVQRQTESMHGYIEGYRRAAEALYEAVKSKRISPVYAVFPLAFLWRQHLELSLKETLARAELLETGEWSHPYHHRLGDLWQRAKPCIIDLGSTDSPEIPIVEANIKEFDRIDPIGMGFRYQQDTKGERSLPHAPEHLNLGQLHEAMLALSNFFDAVRSGLSARCEYKRDWEAEMHSQMTADWEAEMRREYQYEDR